MSEESDDWYKLSPLERARLELAASVSLLQKMGLVEPGEKYFYPRDYEEGLGEIVVKNKKNEVSKWKHKRKI